MFALQKKYSQAPMMVFCIFSFAAAPVCARDNIPVLTGTVSAEEWAALPKNPALADCKEPSCANLRALVASYQELQQRADAGSPDSTARIDENGALTTTAFLSSIQVLLAKSPDQRPDVCNQLQTIAHNYFDWNVGLRTVEIATLIDSGGGTCVDETVAALPKNSDTAILIRTARNDCLARGEPLCQEIRPVDGGEYIEPDKTY